MGRLISYATVTVGPGESQTTDVHTLTYDRLGQVASEEILSVETGDVTDLQHLRDELDAALRAITLSPAEIFGVANELASIAPGKVVNLVLATGDIMDTQVTDVFIDGAPQALETRHTRLYKQFKDRP